jgi:YVTN family beta-propeller protein
MSRIKNVSVIDAASNTVVATVPAGNNPTWVAVAPDGKHAYVSVELSKSVWVIETASNTVGTTVPVANPKGVAVTPDGKHAYVAGSDIVSVIDTAANKVVDTVTSVLGPYGVGIVPPPPGRGCLSSPSMPCSRSNSAALQRSDLGRTSP